MQVDAQSAPEESVKVETRRVACEGGGVFLGHPKVYLEIGSASGVICPYCSCHYVLVEADVVSKDG